MTLNLINRVEHQRKEIPPISGILKRHYRGKKNSISRKKIPPRNFEAIMQLLITKVGFGFLEITLFESVHI